MVICVEPGADLHMTQLLPLPLTVSCFSKIQVGFTFLELDHLGSPGKRAVNVCVCVCVYLATDELKSTMDAEHRKQMTELEQNLADAKRQHTKTGLELLFCCICDKIL